MYSRATEYMSCRYFRELEKAVAGCWQISPAFGNVLGSSPSRPPAPFGESSRGNTTGGNRTESL